MQVVIEMWAYGQRQSESEAMPVEAAFKGLQQFLPKDADVEWLQKQLEQGEYSTGEKRIAPSAKLVVKKVVDPA